MCLRCEVQRTPCVHQRFLTMERPLRRVNETFPRDAVLEPQANLLDQHTVVRGVVGGEALLARRIIAGIAPAYLHAAGDARDLGAVRLVPADQRTDDPRRIDVENLRLRIQRVAAEQRAVHRDVVETKNRSPSPVGLARHPDQALKRERADHQRPLPRRRSGIVRVVVQHRTIQRIQRLVRVVLLRQCHPRTMAKALAGGKILEVEADALPIPILADAMIGAEHGTLRCPGKPDAAYS